MPNANNAGFSPARLATLDRVLRERFVDSGELPGTLIRIWRAGEVVHTGTAGMMDIERGRPMQDDAIFRIYSMSKPITVVALLMLVEEGRIALDDDVALHIPAWRDLGVYVGGSLGGFRTRPPERPMQVIDLFTHMSGLTYGWMNCSYVDAAYRELGVHERDAEGGLDGMIDKLSRLPLEFSPGTAWNYSISMEVMGYLVQRLSGVSFGEFLRARLFGPLGMKDTGFFVPAAGLDRLASCYQPGPGTPLVLEDDAGNSRYARPPKLESGGGGLVSTLEDYLRFCRMLLGGGALEGVRILSPKTVGLFGLNYLPGNRAVPEMMLPAQDQSDWGLRGCGASLGGGVVIDLAARRALGSLGEYFWSGAASTSFWIDPREDLAVVFMTQLVGWPSERSHPFQRLLRTLVYSALTGDGD